MSVSVWSWWLRYVPMVASLRDGNDAGGTATAAAPSCRPGSLPGSARCSFPKNVRAGATRLSDGPADELISGNSSASLASVRFRLGPGQVRK